MTELLALRASKEDGKKALHAVRLENISLRDSQTKLVAKIKALEKQNGELTCQVEDLLANGEKDYKEILVHI